MLTIQFVSTLDQTQPPASEDSFLLFLTVFLLPGLFDLNADKKQDDVVNGLLFDHQTVILPVFLR